MPPATKPAPSIVPTSDALDFSGNTVYGDFRDDLVRDGYVVIKNAMPAERAAEHRDAFLKYIEDFGFGYKRDDPSTLKTENLPVINEKGMIMHYGVSQEDWVWKVRTEPGVVKAFETVYDTEDLICSFDIVNIQWPNRRDAPANKRWAHQDQDPELPGFRCLQGLVNLNPSGPDDGGLVVMKGGHLISEEYHNAFRSEERIWQWTSEWYGYKDTGIEWLKERGYEFEKVEAGPGDFILWDSRTPHYNVAPKGDITRLAVYVCMAPVSTATQEDLKRKADAFNQGIGTTHWPQSLQVAEGPMAIPRRPDGSVCPADRKGPFKRPELNERNFKLTGIPYLKASA